MAQKQNENKNFVGNQMERGHLGRLGCKWEKLGGGVPWIKGHEDLDKWQSVVSKGMDI